MRAALAMRGRFGNIARALRRIHAQYAEPLELAQLAGEAGMSVPSFHSHFKAITQTSPMQYLKCIRLHQARLLMVRQGMSAQAACHAVGYASASQFNREFKRLFGRSPLVEARRLRAGFSLPPAQGERSTCRRISGERTLRWALAIENRPSGARMGSDEEKGTDPTGHATLFSSTTGRLSSDDTIPSRCKARHKLQQGLL